MEKRVVNLERPGLPASYSAGLVIRPNTQSGDRTLHDHIPSVGDVPEVI